MRLTKTHACFSLSSLYLNNYTFVCFIRYVACLHVCLYFCLFFVSFVCIVNVVHDVLVYHAVVRQRRNTCRSLIANHMTCGTSSTCFHLKPNGRVSIWRLLTGRLTKKGRSTPKTWYPCTQSHVAKITSTKSYGTTISNGQAVNILCHLSGARIVTVTEPSACVEYVVGEVCAWHVVIIVHWDTM